MNFKNALIDAKQQFSNNNPKSKEYYLNACKYIPGGTTRSILIQDPFPLTFVSGIEAELIDMDNHKYLDMLGDYTAGLFGHSNKDIIHSVITAMETNMSVGGVHPGEAKLAKLMCERFRLECVRFTNSGTEANLMAITAVLHASPPERKTILVFKGGYHGNVLNFKSDDAIPENAPYSFLIGIYNDTEHTLNLIKENAKSLAGILIEPMLGSGGCIPATRYFLESIFFEIKKIGAFCIVDEVQTSRHNQNGMISTLTTHIPDIITYGKYIGGGFSFGAFGGNRSLLEPIGTTLKHSGTFNNNISTITAACTVLNTIYTCDIAHIHTRNGNLFLEKIQSIIQKYNVPLVVSGYGSVMTFHACKKIPTTLHDLKDKDMNLQELLVHYFLEKGIYIGSRGLITITLTHTISQLNYFLQQFEDILQHFSMLV